ncbi:Rpn family recombination-promoting nuclease/putative transposase, partial [Sellimonas sp.]|uniref:Rpn family recombination-promoting nuclease/putative transposase n=1 Tax=Sellimonas sp. TaxID=2021466 RepID=UPI00257EAF49
TVHFWDEMAGKKYTDKLEIQILELPKLQKKASGPEDVMEWMRFLRGQNKEELKEVAKGNEYLEGAYEDLVKMSLDEKKRLQYEAREKAILDYRSNMEGARKRGFQRGMIQGGQVMLIQLYQKKRLTLEEAAEEANMTVEEFRKLVELAEHSME